MSNSFLEKDLINIKFLYYSNNKLIINKQKINVNDQS